MLHPQCLNSTDFDKLGDWEQRKTSKVHNPDNILSTPFKEGICRDDTESEGNCGGNKSSVEESLAGKI